MSGLNGRPNKHSIDAMRGALGATSDKFQDVGTANQIYNDFKWEILKLPKGGRTYQAIADILDRFIARAKAELKSKSTADQVVGALEKMRARISEWAVDQESESPPEGEPNDDL